MGCWSDAAVEAHYLDRWESLNGWDYMDPPDWETEDDIEVDEEEQ